MVVSGILSYLHKLINIKDPLWKYRIKDFVSVTLTLLLFTLFVISAISAVIGTEWIIRTASIIFNGLSTILDGIIFIATRSAWLQATATTLLAYLTYRSVKNGESLMEANNEMVDANERHVEEAKKERRRDYVKDILINDVRPLNKALKLHQHRISNIRRGSSYKQLPEWDIDLDEYHLQDIETLSTGSDSNPVRLIRNYKSQYELYRSKRESTFDTIIRTLSDSRTIDKIIDRTNWEVINNRNRENLRSRRNTISRHSAANQNKPDQTPEGLRKYVDENTERIAEALLGAESHARRSNQYLPKIKHQLDNDMIVSESFSKLEEVSSDLTKMYYKVVRTRGDWSSLDLLELFLKREYDILEVELQSEIEKEQESQKPESVKIEPATVSVENLEIGAGMVYLRFKDYEKTREDINREDYENDTKYYTALKEETPGKLYNSIRILKGGWIECTDKISSEEANVDLYPPSSVEQIYYSNEDLD